ncbi:pyocin activator PrtN family protein, partial [Escherichia coli]|uniref:pyocin activator PrtN family protein n=1 Tax=Escherichia coli TaxID=562 RepID=UPI0010CB391A
MNPLFLLMAEFNTPHIDLPAIKQKYFGHNTAPTEDKRKEVKLTITQHPIQYNNNHKHATIQKRKKEKKKKKKKK